MNLEDTELFLCRIVNGELRWFSKADVPTKLMEEYKARKTELTGASNFCQIDKTNMYSCLFKCKTRGLILAAYPCGILIGCRDMYGAESLSQIAHMYLDICDAHTGILCLI